MDRGPSMVEIKKRLDKIKEVGCRLTVIMGGEPTTRKDIDQVVKECKKREIVSYLVTNGTLLDKKLADKLGKAGLDVISMSLDTMTPAKNELVNYGKYSLDPDKKLEILRYLQDKYDVVAFVAICITKQDLDEVIPIMNLAKKHDLAVTLTVVANPYVVPNVKDQNWKCEKDSVAITSKQDIKKLGALLKKIRKMKDEGFRIIDPNAYFDRVENFLDGSKKNICKAGKNFFDIDTSGNVMLCVMSEPTSIHYSELNDENFDSKLKGVRAKQLKSCKDNCLLAAYFDASYYGDHLLEYINLMGRIY